MRRPRTYAIRPCAYCGKIFLDQSHSQNASCCCGHHTSMQWARANPEKARKIRLKSDSANHERVRNRNLKWRRANPEKMRAIRRRSKDRLFPWRPLLRKAKSWEEKLGLNKARKPK